MVNTCTEVMTGVRNDSMMAEPSTVGVNSFVNINKSIIYNYKLVDKIC